MAEAPFAKILIANRGEIAIRVIRTAHRIGIRTVAVHSAADANAMHVRAADEAVCIGRAPAAESYLVIANIIEAARQTGAEAIHPGYGFLAENAEFAEACAENGLAFIGPPPAAIRAMGLKDEAKRLMQAAGVPVVPGYHGDDQDAKTLAKAADEIGYPVLIKAVAGGGGKGMRLVAKASEFADALDGARREGKASFGDPRVLVEKFIPSPRHIEMQVFADSHTNVVHLFERDCSLQRRHQKVIEEAPAPGMVPELRRKMGDAAVEAARAIGYRGAGTVEFIVDGSAPLSADTDFYFMEMNTRLQVEHPVTEAITDQDLVAWQIAVAAGGELPLGQDEISLNGHSVEARIYAENPDAGFLPQTGRLAVAEFPEAEDLRTDTGVEAGDEISVHYDPMIAKLIAHGKDRDAAIARLIAGLRRTAIAGLKTNQSFLIHALDHAALRAGDFDTGFIDRHIDELIGDDLDDIGTLSVIAALAVSEDRRRAGNLRRPSKSEPFSPWAGGRGWRLNLPPREIVRLEHAGDMLEVDIRRNSVSRVRIGSAEQEAEIAFNPAGEFSGRIGGSEVEGRIHVTPDVVFIMQKGGTAEFHRAGAGHLDSGDAEGPGAVTAPMPGRILEVRVKEGDKVEKDQPLMMMEAMKMEYTLRAPRDGTVAEIRARPDEQVAEGAMLVSIGEE